MQKGLLRALLTPWDKLKEAQNHYDHTEVLALQEEIKTLPWEDAWNECLSRQGVASESEWLAAVREYEKNVLSRR